MPIASWGPCSQSNCSAHKQALIATADFIRKKWYPVASQRGSSEHKNKQKQFSQIFDWRSNNTHTITVLLVQHFVDFAQYIIYPTNFLAKSPDLNALSIPPPPPPPKKLAESDFSLTNADDLCQVAVSSNVFIETQLTTGSRPEWPTDRPYASRLSINASTGVHLFFN